MNRFNDTIEEIQNIILREEPILRFLSENIITSRFNDRWLH